MFPSHAALLFFSIRLSTSLVAVYLFVVPWDEVLGSITRWFYRTVLESVYVSLENVFPSLATAFMSDGSFFSVCPVWVSLSGYIFRCLTVSLTRRTAHSLWWVALLSRPGSRCVATASPAEFYCSSMCTQCAKNTVFADHDCMAQQFGDSK